MFDISVIDIGFIYYIKDMVFEVLKLLIDWIVVEFGGLISLYVLFVESLVIYEIY